MFPPLLFTSLIPLRFSTIPSLMTFLLHLATYLLSQLNCYYLRSFCATLASCLSFVSMLNNFCTCGPWLLLVLLLLLLLLLLRYCCCLCIVPIVVAADVVAGVGSLNESSPWQHETRTLAHSSGQNNSNLCSIFLK